MVTILNFFSQLFQSVTTTCVVSKSQCNFSFHLLFFRINALLHISSVYFLLNNNEKLICSIVRKRKYDQIAVIKELLISDDFKDKRYIN